MNDTSVTKYTESRAGNYSIEMLIDYINMNLKSPSCELLGIFDLHSMIHIGNIRISEINFKHKFATIGIIIGLKSFWSKGIATEALNLSKEYFFKELKLRKFVAGIYANNTGSIKAFKNVGFEIIGTYKKHRVYDGNYIDQHILELHSDEN